MTRRVGWPEAGRWYAAPEEWAGEGVAKRGCCLRRARAEPVQSQRDECQVQQRGASPCRTLSASACLSDNVASQSSALVAEGTVPQDILVRLSRVRSAPGARCNYFATFETRGSPLRRELQQCHAPISSDASPEIQRANDAIQHDAYKADFTNKFGNGINILNGR